MAYKTYKKRGTLHKKLRSKTLKRPIMLKKNATKLKTAITKLAKEFTKKEQPVTGKRGRKTVSGLNVENIERAKKAIESEEKAKEAVMKNENQVDLRRSTRTRKQVVRFNEPPVEKKTVVKKNATKKNTSKKNTKKNVAPSVMNIQTEEPVIVSAPPTAIKPEEAPAVVAPVVPPTAIAPVSPIANANNANYEHLIKGIKGLHINKRLVDGNKAGRENIVESKMKHLNKSVKKEHIAKWRKNQMREAAKKRFARTIKTARNKTVAAKRLKSAKFGQSAFRPRPTMHIAAEPNNIANMFNQMEIEEL